MSLFRSALKKAVFLLVFAAGLVPLFGRDVMISVEDADLGIPLDGALIRSWDGSTQYCDDDGIAFVTVPDDRQVSVQIVYPGYETGRLVIPRTGDSFKAGLSLGGVLEGKELVIEAQRPGVSETRSGRSVAISGEALDRSSRIGVVEDVMTSIKLLPGVGYTGMFNAMPSVRGGDPGDLMAVFDGFYIDFPYHWGGGFSIFDPSMISSAQLSHGIFSSRYGHTVSGLLELTSKKAGSSASEMDFSLSTSALNLNAAVPFNSKGGVMAMGKLTYWDPFFWAAKQLSKVIENETLGLVNAVTTAPFIRSAQIGTDYRANSDLELSLTYFIGGDGVGATYSNETNFNRTGQGIESAYDMKLLWTNYQTFLITGLTFNPRPTMVLRATAGAGVHQEVADAKFEYDYLRVNYPEVKYELSPEELNMAVTSTGGMLYAQGRTDFDWNLGSGFLMAAGIQELYNQAFGEAEGKAFMDMKVPNDDPYSQIIRSLDPTLPPDEEIYLRFKVQGSRDELENHRFNSSAYILGEFTGPGNKFGAELGFRVDHFYFKGKDFSIQTMPVYNPRLNLDYNIFKNRGIVESLDITVGTGLFSSMTDTLFAITADNRIEDFALKPTRSWTSIAGTKLDFRGGWSFNIEGYYKYVFDRGYQFFIAEPGREGDIEFRFDGDGRVWGFDFMLQKFDSRFFDGWLSYTFTHARYRESLDLEVLGRVRDYWYYPSFHRFHNINMVFNVKPLRNFNVYTRFGLASGRPKSIPGEITKYRVYLLEGEGEGVQPVFENGRPKYFYSFERESSYSDDSRTTWSIPWDMKLSYYTFNSRNKVQTEFYLAAENLASLFYVAKSNTGFNSYTGEEQQDSDSANYEIPIPMVSFGMRWSF